QNQNTANDRQSRYHQHVCSPALAADCVNQIWSALADSKRANQNTDRETPIFAKPCRRNFHCRWIYTRKTHAGAESKCNCTCRRMRKMCKRCSCCACQE